MGDNQVNYDMTTTTSLSLAVLTVYSKDIMFHAQPVLRYAQFATKKTELGVTPGLKITFMRYNNLELGGALEEGTPMGTQALTASQVHIEVKEYGNAVKVSELLLQSSFDDVLASGARLLGLDYAKVVDIMFRDTVLASPNVYYAGGVADREALADNSDGKAEFNSDVIQDAVEILETKNVRKFNGDAYICFIHPHQARTLKDDPDFKNAKDYGAIYAGEIGRVDDVIFISTTQQPVIEVTPSEGDTFKVYQAVIFGDNAYGWAEALPVEMRDGGIEDFGRSHSLAWYSIMGAGIIEEDNILILETR
ncbi:MAG TPA: N4-gp56 family major capsid protein [Thermodesulfovibrio thiophilus]|nr:N4-gp56 family major capsid protein [Thermodesulfovibrio thiophilus]